MKVKKKNPESFYILGYPPSGSYYKTLAIWNFLHLKSGEFGPFMKNPLCKSKSYFSGQNLTKIHQ
jgi:hypothetical protein